MIGQKRKRDKEKPRPRRRSVQEIKPKKENLNRIFTILIKYSIIHGTRLSHSPHVRIVFQMFSLIFSNPLGSHRAHCVIYVFAIIQTHFSIFYSTQDWDGAHTLSHARLGFAYTHCPLARRIEIW